MLSKLLNSEVFSSKVTNSVLNSLNIDSITSQYAPLSGVNNAVTIVEGRKITGLIASKNYNGNVNNRPILDNTDGSVLNLEDGTFNLGAGLLKWDGQQLNISCNSLTCSTPLGIESGGTGATTSAKALENFGINVTAEIINYLDNAESNIQEQLNGKAASLHNHSASDVNEGTLSSERLPTIPIAKGGTGAVTSKNAGKNLMASSSFSSGSGYVEFGDLLIQWGNINVTTTQSGGQTTNNTANFSKAFSSEPRIFVCPRSGAPETVRATAGSEYDETTKKYVGCTVHLYRENIPKDNITGISWFVIGKA